MLVNLQEVLALADQKGCAIPAFNVYNTETVMGVLKAAEELRAPVIFQMYSRLFEQEVARFVSPAILEAIHHSKLPCAFHLDHGSGMPAVQRALRFGCSSVMIDASAKPLEENIATTRAVVEAAAGLGVDVEGELGHVGTTKDAAMAEYTKVDEAVAFVKGTGVSALAILIGTAHGRYKQAPVLDIQRIREIKAATGLPLVLHGGSGVPDDQVRAAIEAGIRKVNFGTDVCYSFLDAVFAVSRDVVAVDMFMKQPIEAVKAFAEEKIKLLGADSLV